MTDETRNKRAVALRYEGGDLAPFVTAKGSGKLAERIEELASEAGVPIEQDPVLAEALSQIELDAQIPFELYQAVATLLSFILQTGSAADPANHTLREHSDGGSAAGTE
ncbi:EscU/YscU/HrcU family type III secretion system export apparatus switch protein [Roseibium sp. RKSG952]|uniref:EscU/YscU/HrcU family type III secretion system export apparatus switch protein n=1 Tax=Roseibium sp. RKSG952 TaxID=2529384 RepID=UPI0012BC1DFD|nr:EscU/YscU/HrcU family type III secretion system export apparatus switch protein [Roseibium sp. RKSG952]MTH95783.1 type III secretion protein [Roseibium sp. RKSG952]